MGLFGRRKDPEPGNTTAVILAGGASSRFGAPKGLATLDGRPLVQWSAGLAAAVSAHTIVVLAPDADEATWRKAVGAPQGGAPDTSLKFVRDELPHHGPVAGVQASLQELGTPFALLLAVDMPLLRPDLVLGLNDRLISHDAVAYHLDGWWRPFPSLWRTQSLAMAAQKAAHRGEASLQALFDLVDARPLGKEFLALFDVEGDALKSVNTKEELEAVADRLSQ